ncbi:MAG: hypothetical protein AB1510_05440 [Bacillota bacterium]
MSRADKGTEDGWQEPRQIVRDLLELQLRGGFTGDNLLLLLGMLSVFGVVEFVGRRQDNGEGEALHRMIGSLASSFLGGKEGSRQGELQSAGRSSESTGSQGGKDGWKVIMSLLSNPEVLQMVIPLLTRLGGLSNPRSAAPKDDSTLPRKRRPQQVRWDFDRSGAGKKGGNGAN